ncbi:hypothetical protein [Tamlana flava]|uniref:hypothetical protein n=1 Tax=Tamlana flava TaxID=3158572 RepID=UPI00351BBD30
MKTKRIIYLAFIICAIAFLDCSSDNSNEVEERQNTMSAYIDVQLITWKVVSLRDKGDNYEISGLAADNVDSDLTHSFKIYFNPTSGPGVYNFDGVENYVEYYVYRGGIFDSTIDYYYYSPPFCNDEYQNIVSGKIELTSFNSVFKGTFEFVATEKCETKQTQITEGKFEIGLSMY